MIVKKEHLLFFLFTCFFSFAQKESAVDKAESLSVKNPVKALQTAKNLYGKGDLNNNEQLRILYLLSYTSAITQKPLEALDYGELGLNAAEKQQDTLMQLKLLSNLGNVYQSFQLNEKTKEYLDRAEHLLNVSTSGKKGDYLKGNIYYLQAMNYAYSLDSDIAISYFDKAIVQYGQSKQPLAIVNLKLAYLNKAFCLMNLKQFNKAQQCIDKATIGLAKNENPESYPDAFVKRQEICVRWGQSKIDTELNRSQKAITELLSLLDNKDQVEVLDIKSGIYELLSENYLKVGNMQSSENYHLLYQNELHLREKKMATMQNEFLKKEKEKKDLMHAAMIRQYQMTGIFIGVFFLMIILLIVLRIRKSLIRTESLKKQIFNQI